MARVVRSLLLLSLLPVASSGSSSVQICGVAASDQHKFQTGEFSCVIGGKVANLPISRANDEFCDCDDGLDEPGTSACSYIISSEFHCENGGFFPGKIHTSRVRDGICDCCDGSDEEIDGKSPCYNTCEIEAESFRKKAEKRLEIVKSGFEKRQVVVNGQVASFFKEGEASETKVQKELKQLALLKDRVMVHKDREELREKKFRMEFARQKQADGQRGKNDDNDQFSDAIDKEDVEALEFEGLDAIGVADDDIPIHSDEDDRASEVLDSRRETVKSLIELPDGTKISLADYLRMDHHKQPATKKLCMVYCDYRRVPRTAEQMRREDFLGPLFNGGTEGRKKIGLYALRTIGIVMSPVRGLMELVLFAPRTLWEVLSTSDVAESAISQLPDFPSPSRSVWFRQLGGGSVYDGYSSVMWGARVVWDAPVYAYHYLFPKLDKGFKLPVAESLRKVLREIDADIAKLEKERNDKREAAKLDYGPDRAYYALKENCIEKRIEKYMYKFCAFGEVKQDGTKLGKWDGWATNEANDSSGGSKTDYTGMRFSKGQRCYKGPERSVLVQLECGEDTEILTVDEPSTCVYEMNVRSPLACTAQVLAQAQKDVAFWTHRR